MHFHECFQSGFGFQLNDEITLPCTLPLELRPRTPKRSAGRPGMEQAITDHKRTLTAWRLTITTVHRNSRRVNISNIKVGKGVFK
jgi:hypothetical protein